MSEFVVVITSAPGNSARFPGLFWATLLVCVLGLGSTVALAQTDKPELRTADEEFSKQLSELKRTFADLSQKFEDSAQTIDRLNSAEADARKSRICASTWAGCSEPWRTTARCGP
jgi:hypothetical protein